VGIPAAGSRQGSRLKSSRQIAFAGSMDYFSSGRNRHAERRFRV
jgi:hypothetical protein